MDTVIDYAAVGSVVKILNEDPEIFRHLATVMNLLGVPVPDQIQFTNGFSTNTITGDEILRKVLNRWVCSNGDGATFLKLIQLLRGNNFTRSAGRKLALLYVCGYKYVNGLTVIILPRLVLSNCTLGNNNYRYLRLSWIRTIISRQLLTVTKILKMYVGTLAAVRSRLLKI